MSGVLDLVGSASPIVGSVFGGLRGGLLGSIAGNLWDSGWTNYKANDAATQAANSALSANYSNIYDAAGPGYTYDAFGTVIPNDAAATTQADQMGGAASANVYTGLTPEGGLSGSWLNFLGSGYRSNDPSRDTPANRALRTVPGYLALDYAKGHTPVDLTNLNDTYNGVVGNRGGYLDSVTNPLRQRIASGYGDMLQSQGLRGVRGASFADQAIGDYLSSAGSSLSSARSGAMVGSLALQGGLAGDIAKLTGQNQSIKNNLYGRAFDILGRGVNPPGYNSISLF